jgi:hypothetical protein
MIPEDCVTPSILHQITISNQAVSQYFDDEIQKLKHLINELDGAYKDLLKVVIEARNREIETLKLIERLYNREV